MMCFYSKLVRLKVWGTSIRSVSFRLFLFQTGAIKSKTRLFQNLIWVVFLFQTGAIKSVSGYNAPMTIHVFLFQTGAIKSAGIGEFIDCLIGFYSKLVRLKVYCIGGIKSL